MKGRLAAAARKIVRNAGKRTKASAEAAANALQAMRQQYDDAIIFDQCDPIYHRRLIFLLGEHDVCEQAMRIHLPMTDEAVMDDLAGSAGCCGSFINTASSVRIFYIWRRSVDVKPSCEDMAGLAHEAFHFVTKALREVGMRHGPDSEEAYAYYLHWTMNALLVGLLDKRKKIRRRRANG